MSEILDYLATRNWHPTSYNKVRASGLCMFHNDHEPSLLVVYENPGDEHFTCLSCGMTGTLVRLILFYEFGDNTSCWLDAYQRLAAWRGDTPSSSSSSPSHRSRELVFPTEEQTRLLSAFMSWAHTQLLSPIGMKARAYLRERGLGTWGLSPRGVSYVPGDGNSFQQLVNRLHSADDNWHEHAVAMGILNKAGGLRLADRVIFFQQHDGVARYYQARVIGEPRTKERKWLNPPVLSRIPFSIPIPAATAWIPGTIIVENPIAAALITSRFHVNAIATGGAGCYINLHAYEPPFYLCQDADKPQRDNQGRVYHPGDRQAEEIANLCDEEGYEWHRIRPPEIYKDPDTWILKAGDDAFLSHFQQRARSL